jgi:hypothetical protein
MCVRNQIVRPSRSRAETQPKLQPAFLRLSATISPILHRVAPTLTRNSAQRLCKCRRFDCTINVCSKQSAYGNGAGVVAVALRPSVVSDVELGLSSGVGVGVASDFGLAPCPAPCLAPCPAPWLAACPAPWLAPCPAPWLAPCPAPFECRAREDCMVCALKLLSAPCL